MSPWWGVLSQRLQFMRMGPIDRAQRLSGVKRSAFQSFGPRGIVGIILLMPISSAVPFAPMAFEAL